MLDPAAAIDAPFVSQGIMVQPDWIDFNGHMNVAYYIRAFDLAFDQIYKRFGFGVAELQGVNGTTMAADLHITYQRELFEGDPIRVTTQLVEFDRKRCHFFQAMYQAEKTYLAATSEWLILNVDIVSRRVTEMPDALFDHLTRIRDAHAKIPAAPELGRSVSIRNKRRG